MFVCLQNLMCIHDCNHACVLSLVCIVFTMIVHDMLICTLKCVNLFCHCSLSAQVCIFMHLQHFLCLTCHVRMFHISQGLCIYNIFACTNYKFDAYLFAIIKKIMPNVSCLQNLISIHVLMEI